MKSARERQRPDHIFMQYIGHKCPSNHPSSKPGGAQEATRTTIDGVGESRQAGSPLRDKDVVQELVTRISNYSVEVHDAFLGWPRAGLGHQHGHLLSVADSHSIHPLPIRDYPYSWLWVPMSIKTTIVSPRY